MAPFLFFRQIRRDTAIPQIHGSSATDTVVTKQEQHAAEGEGVEVGSDILPVAECGKEVHQSQFAVQMSTMLLQMMEGRCAEGSVPVEGAGLGSAGLGEDETRGTGGGLIAGSGSPRPRWCVGLGRGEGAASSSGTGKVTRAAAAMGDEDEE